MGASDGVCSSGVQGCSGLGRAELARLIQNSEQDAKRHSEVLASAREAQSVCKAAIAKGESVKDCVEKTREMSNDLDRQWDAFKSKFQQVMDACSEAMCQGMGGSVPKSRRLAELVDEAVVAQILKRSKRLVVLTGAGISAESGIPTFRGQDGYWTVGSQNYRPQELATWEKFDEMPDELWKWYQYRWGVCRDAKPNPGHRALVALERLVCGGAGYDLVTQNIDSLHLRAGSDPTRLHEVHGRLSHMRCDDKVEGACMHGVDLNEAANFERARSTIFDTPVPNSDELKELLPTCNLCGVRQRPKILWFDESYNEAFYRSKSVGEAAQKCDVLLVVGTQLTTGLPQRIMRAAQTSGATIIRMDPLIDLDEHWNAGALCLQAKSGEALPRIVAELEQLKLEPDLAPVAKLSPAVSPFAIPKSKSIVAPKAKPKIASREPGLLPIAAPKSKASIGTKRASSLSSAPPRRASSPGLSRPSSAARAAASALGLGGTPASACNDAWKTSIQVGDAQGFFVYGSLRPDDDSGAPWTKEFCKGLNAEPARLFGASLYVESFAALCLERTRCSVRGCFLSVPGGPQLFSAKLAEADRIEGYPDLYERSVVTVRTSGGDSKLAYVYHRTGRVDRSKCVRIADGDWLSRPREENA